MGVEEGAIRGMVRAVMDGEVEVGVSGKMIGGGTRIRGDSRTEKVFMIEVMVSTRKTGQEEEDSSVGVRILMEGRSSP
jgi:hypothetical protein